MKCLKILCVIALVFAFSAVAFAETQSVKVSGDITMRAFARNHYNLAADQDTPNAALTTSRSSTSWATYLLSTAEVQVDADLTDNVAGVIRLVNQRIWGDNNYVSDNATAYTPELMDINSNGLAITRTVTGADDAFAVDVDLAYIELKEFLYSPLTVKIGRQDLWFGNGFVVGAQFTDPRNTIYPKEYTAILSFDAARLTFDFDPLTIDAVYAKISENARRADDDVNLWGVNVGYVFDGYNADMEGYFWAKQDRNPGLTSLANFGSTSSTGNIIDNSIYLFGARGSIDPIEDLTLGLEAAYQTGQYLGLANQAVKRTRSAWAVNAIAESRYFQEKLAWKPVIGMEYILYSGAQDQGDNLTGVYQSDTYTGWDIMYRGKFVTAIREFQNVFYQTNQAGPAAFTNQQQILARAMVEPMDDLTVKGVYSHFWLVERYSRFNTAKNIGDEIDVELLWDYTEDVSFSFLAGWFIPGNFYKSPNNKPATDIVGTVKLSF